MKAKLIHRKKCGIYAIFNKINGKVYIGKALNIHGRIKNHIGFLNGKSTKHENQHLINSWCKYGRNSFCYTPLVYCSVDKLSENELFFMKLFQSTDRAFGYNLRMDSSTGMICSEETRYKMSQSRNLRESRFPELGKQVGAKVSTFWKENPDAKLEMAFKMSNAIRIYKIAKLGYITSEMLEVFNSKKELLHKHPTYYYQAILGCCQGNKKSYKGFKWCYLDKNTDEKIVKK